MYFNYSLLCLFFSRFVWLTYTLCWISHWLIASMKETLEEKNGYVVFKWNIHADQLGNRVGVLGKALLRPPPPPSTANIWTDVLRRRERFFPPTRIFGYGYLHESTSPTPTPFYSKLLDRYLKTTWTVFPPPRIFASWKHLSEYFSIAGYGYAFVRVVED